MSDNPYDKIVFLDGTRVFKNSEAERLEAEVAKSLEDAWRCLIIKFAKLSPIDWYAERDHRTVGLLELKTREKKHDEHQTVFLAVRKWLALLLGSIGMGVPGLFVVRFTDGTFWIPVREIDPSRHMIGGRTDRGAPNDIEPGIRVEIAKMHKLEEAAA